MGLEGRGEGEGACATLEDLSDESGGAADHILGAYPAPVEGAVCNAESEIVTHGVLCDAAVPGPATSTFEEVDEGEVSLSGPQPAAVAEAVALGTGAQGGLVGNVADVAGV